MLQVSSGVVIAMSYVAAEDHSFSALDIDTHSHVLKYTQVRRIALLMAAWLLASTHTLAYSLTIVLTSLPNTTTLSTTSYPYALTMVVPVMCTYVS